MANPPAGLLIEGARLILPQLVEDPLGLPPFVESLLWSPSSSGPLPGSNPFPNVLPILMKDLPGSRSSRESFNEEAASLEAGAAAAGAAIGARAAALGENAAQTHNTDSAISSPSSPAPAPNFFDRVQEVVTHPTPTQSLLIGIGSSILFPTLSAAAALQSSGLISQAGFSQGFAPGAGAVLTFAAVKPVSSSKGAHSDSDGSGGSQSGSGQSGGNSSRGDQNPHDENPHRDS
jgi:hypothetical protein